MSLRSLRHPDQPHDRVVLALLVSMIGVVVALVLILWKLSGLNNTPAWWAELDNNPLISEQSGIELENRLTTALTRLRPAGKEEWAAAIGQDQLNSWLTHRLKDTVRSFSIDSEFDQLGDVRINIDPAGITAGARFEHTHGSTIVWAIVTLGISEDGRFVIEPQRTYLGNTRVPAGLASRYLTSENLGGAEIDLGDGRRVRIRAIRSGDHRLEFALRTEVID